MKRFKTFVVLGVFTIFVVAFCFSLPLKQNFAFASDENSFNITIDAYNKSEQISFKIREDAKKYIGDIKQNEAENLALFLKMAYKKGIMPEYALEFCFEDFSNTIMQFIVAHNVEAQNAILAPIKNTGKVYLKNAVYGKEIEKSELIFDIFNNLVQKNTKITAKFNTILPQIDNGFYNNLMHLRGKFFTTYVSSTNERKHNIEKALSCFDGLTIWPNEILSFNKVTGIRSEENGYKGAKIIINGEFVEGFGGGVCQASTTLYNACLVSGLEIVEANQHSLKVNYIAPSFDAMVNTGSNDLKIRNNTGYPITLATKCDGTTCEVFVYGAENKYKIVRRSEVLSEKAPADDEIIFTSEIDNNFKENNFYYKIAPKNEVVSEGFLDYYKNGILEQSVKIRHNTYKGVRGVKVVKNSN